MLLIGEGYNKSVEFCYVPGSNTLQYSSIEQMDLEMSTNVPPPDLPPDKPQARLIVITKFIAEGRTHYLENSAPIVHAFKGNTLKPLTPNCLT
jgi:hypothetical protein